MLNEQHQNQVLNSLQKAVQAIAVLNSESFVNIGEEGSEEREKIQKREQQKRKQAEKKLAEARKSAEAFLGKIKIGIEAQRKTAREIQSALQQNKQQAGREGLQSALGAARNDINRLSRWQHEINLLLQSANHSPSFNNEYAGTDENWLFLQDEKGAPYLKEKSDPDRKISLHYDEDHNLNASHIKDRENLRKFINPADAFLLNSGSAEEEYEEEEEEAIETKAADDTDAGINNPDEIISEVDNFHQRLNKKSIDEMVNSVLSMQPKNYTSADIPEKPGKDIDPFAVNYWNHKPGYVGYDSQGLQDLVDRNGMKQGSVKDDYIYDNIGKLVGKIEREWDRDFIRTSEGKKYEILADGAVMNEYHTEQFRINNYLPPPTIADLERSSLPSSDQIYYYMNRGLQNTFNSINQNNLGNGYYQNNKSNYNP